MEKLSSGLIIPDHEDNKVGLFLDVTLLKRHYALLHVRNTTLKVYTCQSQQ